MKKSAPHFRTVCSTIALMAAVGTAAGCTTFGLGRTEIAHRLAAPSFMIERQVPVAPFVLTVYERIRQPGAPINIYIEGDGQSWVSRHEPSLDPTPINPVALHLASRDNAPNVIYMARPCQYSKTTSGQACPIDYWTSKRFAPEVIQSMNGALDDIKHRYGATGFNLVGYSGGAAVAILLAADRSDVLTLRTVAGNLDPALFDAMHKVSAPVAGTLSPMNVAGKISNIPQRHFIGEWDEIVTPALYDSFSRAAARPNDCVHSTIVAKTDHDSGWVNKWPELLKEPLTCTSNQ